MNSWRDERACRMKRERRAGVDSFHFQFSPVFFFFSYIYFCFIHIRLLKARPAEKVVHRFERERKITFLYLSKRCTIFLCGSSFEKFDPHFRCWIWEIFLNPYLSLINFNLHVCLCEVMSSFIFLGFSNEFSKVLYNCCCPKRENYREWYDKCSRK